jgi:CHAT domain-containing protein
LAFLPLHAAGSSSDCVSDYVISSYTPNLNALLTPLSPTTLDFKMVVAIQPNAPGSFPLRHTHNELAAVRSIVPNENLTVLGVENTPASVENVLSHLSNASIAHFACHGHQDFSNPLESGLKLDGGKMLKISQLMAKPMPKALLAYLSACETAMGAETIADEAMHIAASMLFAGFHGVVATMW